MTQGVVFKGDGEDPMHEVLSDYADYEVTALLRDGRWYTGPLTWVDHDDEYQIGEAQFPKSAVVMLIVFE